MRRPSISVLAFVLLLAGCAVPPPPTRMDLTGRWVGTWSGHGVLEIPRDEATVLDLVQSGWSGQGRLTMDGTLAADSVPIAIRNVTGVGIRVYFETRDDRVRLEHELGPQYFAAEMFVRGDRMVGQVLEVTPYVYFDLVRDRTRAVSVPVVVAPSPPAPPPPPPQPPAVVTPPPPPAPIAEPSPPPVAEPPRVAERESPPAEVPVTVRTRPPARPVDFSAVAPLRPIYFDFDSAAIRPGDAAILDANAEWLQANPDQLVLIGGYCDERGTSEYNIALGERRARAAVAYLLGRGIAEERMTITSYGFERPDCPEHTEACWALNRRVLMVVKPR